MIPSVETVTFEAPKGRFRATCEVPGDKSLTHRALLLAGMARGASRVSGAARGSDIQSTRAALEALGVDFDDDRVTSPGVDAWVEPGDALDLGNSATALRLLAGAMAGHPFRVTLTGDASLSGRPMRRLIGPLGALGASIEVSPDGTPPVVTGGGRLRGAAVQIGVPSAQVRSAFELAALQAEGGSSIDSPGGFRDHTERWLAALSLGRWISATRFEVMPGPVPPGDYSIARDPSSASLLWAAAAMSEGSRIRTPEVSLNPGRTGFLDVLEDMGARVERRVDRLVMGDPVGDVTVTGAGLRGTHIGAHLAVRTIDELPLVAMCAGIAEGETRVVGAGELRVKESDRIVSVVELLRSLGADAETTDDGFIVSGGTRYRAGRADSRGDHRIAMAAAVAAVAADGPVTVDGFDAASVSWPGFSEALEAAWSSQ